MAFEVEEQSNAAAEPWSASQDIYDAQLGAKPQTSIQLVSEDILTVESGKDALIVLPMLLDRGIRAVQNSLCDETLLRGPGLTPLVHLKVLRERDPRSRSRRRSLASDLTNATATCEVKMQGPRNVWWSKQRWCLLVSFFVSLVDSSTCLGSSAGDSQARPGSLRPA